MKKLWVRLEWLLAPLLIFAASRVAVLAAIFITKLFIQATTLREVMIHWDATWYLSAAEGYDRRVPAGIGNPAQSNIAFFPAFPLAVRAVSFLTGLSLPASGLIAATLAGGLAAIAVWKLGETVADRELANKSVAILSFFPGAFAFSSVYPEGLFIFAGAACLWALIKQRWLLAGLMGALGTAARPNALILIACCAWAALFAVLHHRQWRSLVAPAVAPLGILSFFAFLTIHTGNQFAWFEAQERGWGNHVDFGVNTVRTVVHTFANPSTDLNLNVATASLGVAILGGFLLVKWRPPNAFGLFAIFSAGIVISIVMSATGFAAGAEGWSVGFGFPLRPRTLMTAFPLLMALSWAVRGVWFTALIGFSATLLGLSTILFGASLLLTP